ncbi:hypothetical protein GXW82_32725 [Streptacidiphilus sp. 4-A2]|nr:hypothetical protein [Streptacidiphilus sp. 4-A2]
MSVAGKPTGPWSTPKLLFPTDETNPYTGRTFDADCGTINAHGCFEPRMIKRPDGAWLLWFDEVNGQTSATTSSIFAFGCNGPAGPCGTTAGTRTASSTSRTSTSATEPTEASRSAWTPPARCCSAAPPHHVRGTPGQQLDHRHQCRNGRARPRPARRRRRRVPGPASGTWILTYSDQPCGYCTGTSTSYATATSLMGPWTTPDNHGQGGWPADARRKVSASTCGGQTNTISVINGQAYQGIDLWTGSNNEAKGNLDFVPLTYTPTDGSAGDGRIWTPPLTLTC